MESIPMFVYVYISHFQNRDRTVYQKEIEKVFGLRAPTATALINSLEKMGIIQRLPAKEDARFKELVLTKKAERFREDVYSDIEMLEKKLTATLSKEELDCWISTTQKILANLGEERT